MSTDGVFGWKTVIVVAVWALVLLPALLAGPIRLGGEELCLVIDPAYLLLGVGGVLFGVWGGVLSPLAAMLLVAWGTGGGVGWEWAAPAGLAALTGWMLPLTTRSGSEWPYWLRKVVALGLLPLLWGVSQVGLGGAQPLEMDLSLPLRVLVSATGYALLFLWPGQQLIRLAAAGAAPLGLLLLDRWGGWSTRRWPAADTGGVSWGLALTLLALSLVPVVGHLIGQSWQTLERERNLEHRLLVVRSRAAEIDSYLAQQRSVLDLAAMRVPELRQTPEALGRLLLDALKSHQELLKLEFLDLSDDSFTARLAQYAPETAPAGPPTGPAYYLAPLRRTADGAYNLSLGRRVTDTRGLVLGWLFSRCDGARVAAMLGWRGGVLTREGELLLADRRGEVFHGRWAGEGPLPLRRELPIQIGEDGRGRWLTIHAPLQGGRWHLVYREPYPHHRLAETAARTGWPLAVHLSLLLGLAGLAQFVRRAADG